MSFNLQFSIAEIPKWATLYQNTSEGWDASAEAIAESVKARGFMTHEDFVVLCNWKSPRIRPRCQSNTPDFVEEITRIALSTSHERLRVEVLTLLGGVQWPVASVILHWCHREPYPILDYRALWSLSFEQPPTYSFDFWSAYTAFCRNLAAQAHVSMRELDRALWAYSKQNQP